MASASIPVGPSRNLHQEPFPAGFTPDFQSWSVPPAEAGRDLV